MLPIQRRTSVCSKGLELNRVISMLRTQRRNFTKLFWGVPKVALRDFLSVTFFLVAVVPNGPLSSKLPWRNTFYYHFCRTKQRTFEAVE